MGNLSRLLVALAVAIASIGMVPSTNIGAEPGWEQSGLTEQVSALAVDPTDEKVVLATGVSGLWRTVDGGTNWSLVSPEKIASALAIDPKNPLILYAGGNPARGGGGIYKSTDGGKNWSIVRPGESPGTIVIDPATTNTVYAGMTLNGNHEIFKSTDGGANWYPQLRPKGSQSPGIGSVTALALAPSKPSVVYAGLGIYHGGLVYRSDDGGSIWGLVSSGNPAAALMAPSSIAVDPQNPDVVYAGWALMGTKRFFSSVDGGGSWQNLSAGLPAGGSSVLSLLVDPTQAGTLLAAMPGSSSPGTAGERPGGLFISYDSGSSWSQLGTGNADKSRIALAPRSRILYAGGGSGVSSYRLGFRIDPRFQSYYDSHDGLRVLGSPIGLPQVLNGYTIQYFEKGRIEDHGDEVADANWKLMYGLLVDELQAAKSSLPVGGEVSTVTYADLYNYARPAQRVAPPSGFQGGVTVSGDGSAFVPYHHELKAESGHNVPQWFWDYLNRDDLFPGGWLHDIGLPMTEAVWAKVDKGDIKGRDVLIQAFQRTVLTFDPANPPDWQVERANVGTDYNNYDKNRQ